MAGLPESPNFEDEVYQLETTDPVVAGPEGISNLQGRQLANRTAWLKQQVDQLLSDFDSLTIEDIGDLISATDSTRGLIRIATQAEVNAGTETNIATPPSALKFITENIFNSPLYPEIFTESNKLELVHNSTTKTITIAENQEFWSRKSGLVSTSDYSATNRTFNYVSDKTYHLRWDHINGFRLLDLSDVDYNPGTLDGADVIFDTTFDDMLVADYSNNLLSTLINCNDYHDQIYAFSIAIGLQDNVAGFEQNPANLTPTVTVNLNLSRIPKVSLSGQSDLYLVGATASEVTFGCFAKSRKQLNVITQHSHFVGDGIGLWMEVKL